MPAPDDDDRAAFDAIVTGMEFDDLTDLGRTLLGGRPPVVDTDPQRTSGWGRSPAVGDYPREHESAPEPEGG